MRPRVNSDLDRIGTQRGRSLSNFVHSAGCESPLLALFGPDRPGWRRLFLKVQGTSQLRAPRSENDPTQTLSRVGACLAT